MKTGIAIAIALLLAPSVACAQERNSLAMDLGTNPAPTNAFEGNKVADGNATHKSAFGRVMDVMIASLMQQKAHPSNASAKNANAQALQHTLRPATAAKPASPAIDITLGGEFALPPENDALTHPESEATAANL